MTTTTTAAELRFEAPGEGFWELDPVHFPRPDAGARRGLESEGDSSRVLAELRALEVGTGAAVSVYLDLVGYRLLDGFDIWHPYAPELADAVRRAIRPPRGDAAVR